MKNRGQVKDKGNEPREGTLFTIGYEGRSLNEILELLVAHGVTIVVDIREIPLSRRNGFSKTALRRFLLANDLEYRHFHDLGSPGHLRRKVRSDGDMNSFLRHFRQHLSTKDSTLQQVAALLTQGCICLMCYEADHRRCHRQLVADRIRRIAGKEVVHL